MKPSPPTGQKPLLMLDIDGVISLFGFGAASRPEGSLQWVDGIPHFISASAARHLLELSQSFALVWASGWEERANEYLPHLLGLPHPLPFLRFDSEGSAGRQTHAHWKLAAIEAYASDRALAWVDDAFNEACHEWSSRRGAPTLLLQAVPCEGLTERQVKLLLRWAKELPQS